MPRKSNIKNKKDSAQKYEDRLERSVAPNSTIDPDRQRVNKEMDQRDKKELISTFQEQLGQKQIENDLEIRRTLARISHLRKENERIQRQQVAEYGVTLDMLQELRINLDKTKSQNDKLHEDMIEAKELHDKLEIDLKETQRRYDDALKEIEGLQKKSKVWSSVQPDLLKSEERCLMLMRNNKKLKIILLKNHVNPSTDPREFSRELPSDRKSVRSNKSFPEISPRRKPTVINKFKSIGEVVTFKKLQEEDTRRSLGIPYNHVNPAYVDYFAKKRMAKRDDSAAFFYRLGTSLPRIVFD